VKHWVSLLSDNGVGGCLNALLEDMDAQQWFEIILVQDCPRTQMIWDNMSARMMEGVTMPPSQMALLQ
jgi:hypothetical protein